MLGRIIRDVTMSRSLLKRIYRGAQYIHALLYNLGVIAQEHGLDDQCRLESQHGNSRSNVPSPVVGLVLLEGRINELFRADTLQNVDMLSERVCDPFCYNQYAYCAAAHKGTT